MFPAVPIHLPDSLVSRKEEFEGYLTDAYTNLRAFALSHGWESHLSDPYINEVRVFDSKEQLDAGLITLFGLDPKTILPSTYCAALEEKVLFIVTPELYADLYPQGVEKDYYVKLVVHEIAHRFHIRLLDGDEEAMGPIWFYEGFATLVADQFSGHSTDLSCNTITGVLHDDKRGNYRTYNAIMRLLVVKVPLEELVPRASEDGFSEWVLQQLC